jgi:two-component system, NtrC family, nitrogen regulation sensor histidine kinase NtrY
MTWKRTLGVAALHGAVLLLAAWVSWGGAVWPAAASVVLVTGLIVLGRPAPVGGWAGAFLLAGIMVAMAGEWHLHRLAQEWPERSRQWEETIRLRLGDSLDDLIDQGEGAAAELARWSREGRLPTGPQLPPGLRPRRVDALALFGPGGELRAWSGSHQGPIPTEVRRGEVPHLYREGPLFGYLYITEPLGEGRGAVMAAFVLRADLPPTLEPPGTDFVSRFRQATGAELHFARDEGREGEAAWEVTREGRPLLNVVLAPPSEAQARAARELAWSRTVALLLALGWLLAVLGFRGLAVGPLLAALSLPFALLILPLERLAGGTAVFSPAHFLLPGPVALTLGDLAALFVGLVAVMAFLPGGSRLRLPAWAASALGVLGAAVVLRILAEGAATDFLAGSDMGWVAFQGAATLGVVVPLGMVLILSAPPRERGWSPLGVISSLVGALALGALATVSMRRDPAFPILAALVWVVPLWGLLRSLPGDRGWLMGAVRWIAVVVVATSLVLPWAWGQRTDARMTMAQDRVERLGTRPDPFVEFLLQRAGERAGELADAGRDPVEVLYRAWSDAGLAWEGVPLWLTYWSREDLPLEELRIGVPEQRPSVPPVLLGEARETGVVVLRRYDLADAHYVAAAALPAGEVVTFVVPPRRVVAGSTPFGPLFSPTRVEPDPIVLIPLLPGEIPGGTDRIRWISTPEGWQGEVYLAFPDELYHAHYHLDVASPLLMVARATLILLLNILVLTFFWALGRSIGEGRPGGIRRWAGTLGSFRGRVTLALFAFFLIPAILFGTLAYRTLAGAAVRTAEALAERAVEDAAAWYEDVGGAVDVLAQRVGSDLLIYDGGELVAGSLRELVDLGLYEGWLPPDIHRHMTEGEEVMTTATGALGGWDYVMAYRRIAGGRVLAAPSPLQAGAMALRQRDVADLLGFAVVAGAFFSVLLALLVSRALTRPIQTLRVASERVGAGNMSVHLPEDRGDEFGTVFDAFNRMVDNLASARRALLRSSRRTRAIVEEVATGVVALDSHGRVGLVNPRAEELLGVPLPVGEPLPGGEGDEDPRGVLSSWVEAYFRDGVREASTELAVGDQRIRVRARRISRRGPLGGAVLSLEDVTDELRTERILAWGEMARQVAHEVKNPLTPIKLGVQHIRRAWEDGRPDYEAILERNVDAILTEIDRLASISTSFSRFGAPGPAGRDPLEAVEVDEVAREVMDLYAAAEGPVRVTYRDPGPLLPVQARSRELKEVLVNLLENARSAMPEGGEVRMEVGPLEAGVELRISDDGPGIPTEIRPRVFEPHFSTRSGGSGLGLAIVRRLVESWGGRVEVAEDGAPGTTIRLVIPSWSEGQGAGRIGEGGPDRYLPGGDGASSAT